MFFVEALLNLVIYVRNMHSKNTEAPFRIYYYIYYCLKWYTYSCNREISSKYRRSALFFNDSSFCFDFSSFQTAHRNKNKLRTHWGLSSHKIKNNEPRQNLLVLFLKRACTNYICNIQCNVTVRLDLISFAIHFFFRTFQNIFGFWLAITLKQASVRF